ncbi:MAG: hypothetical protein IKZ12_05450 [Alistipes sp.]|nr:hypothetical protein [Alistipes sp.]
MKKFLLLIAICFSGVVDAQIAYTPFFRDEVREDVHVPNLDWEIGSSRNKQFERPSYSNSPEPKGTLTVVKNCILISPNNTLLEASIHVKKTSEGAFSLGILHRGVFMWLAPSDIHSTKDLDNISIEDQKRWPYIAVWKGSDYLIIGFLPNLQTTDEPFYEFESHR